LITPVKNYPALLIQKQKEHILVVADLHIGWEVKLAEKGIHVPSQTPKILEKIIQLIEDYKPTGIIFLGDVKHAIAKVEMEEWRDIPDFFEAIAKRVPNIQIIPGNHDGNLEPLLPEIAKVWPSTGIVFGNVGLFHGHTWPAPELLKCRDLVTGHVHPTVAFRDPIGFRITRQVWVKAKCNSPHLAKSLLKSLNIKLAEDPIDSLQKHFKIKFRASNLFIMPSFNDFLGGRPINEKNLAKDQKSSAFIGPILRSKSVNIDDSEVYMLDGTFLGTVNQLKAIS
jgi:putative SbcD/Mre11-related phosphoesterase